MKFGTKVIHAGLQPDPATGAIMTPIYQTTTYVQDAPHVHKGYAYGRTHNPTRTALQNNLAALENAKYAVCFSSGMAAADAVIRLFKPGDDILVSADLYGGTYRLFTQSFADFGIQFRFVNMNDATSIEQHILPNTKMLWLETPSNPTLRIIDLAAVGNICKKQQILFCVDNTFATPYLQQPFNFGADLIVHSATKYLGGHSDVILGAVLCNEEALHKKLAFTQNAVGAIPSPMECFLALRGIKTLKVRMAAHCENAAAIANYLQQHPKVAQVNWPGFSHHPNHAIAKQQMRNFGGVVSFSLKEDTLAAGLKMLSNTHLFALAESLGGVESLIGHPASMTHAAIPKADRLKMGVFDSLVRLSIGIEDAEDLLTDLERSLDLV